MKTEMQLLIKLLGVMYDLSDSASTPVAGRLANDALPNFLKDLPRDIARLHNVSPVTVRMLC